MQQLQNFPLPLPCTLHEHIWVCGAHSGQPLPHVHSRLGFITVSLFGYVEATSVIPFLVPTWKQISTVTSYKFFMVLEWQHTLLTLFANLILFQNLWHFFFQLQFYTSQYNVHNQQFITQLWWGIAPTSKVMTIWREVVKEFQKRRLLQ